MTKKLFKKEWIYKKLLALCLIVSLFVSSCSSFFQTPLSPKVTYAASSSSCTGSADPARAQLSARVGGVALDMAAQFLANMNDITGAYYDAALDRIVFVGKKNTTL